MIRLLRAGLVCAALVAMGTSAHAALSLCNRTSYILYAAFARPESGQAKTPDQTKAKAWQVKGWTRITPGLCVTVLPGRLTARTYLVRARSSLAHSGPQRAWGGGRDLCVRDGDFTLMEQDHAKQCPDGFPLGFAAVMTGGQADWTMTFNQNPPIASLEEAQLAGVRRLLKDNGYKVGSIMGAPDKETGVALAAFRKTLPPDAGNAALFTALEDRARERVAPAGVTACNDGKMPLLVALGQSGQGKVTARGWWTVAPNACARLVTTPLAGESLALLARTKDGRTLKGGPQRLCISDQAFQISDAGGDCAARDFETAGFAPIPTRGAAGVIVHLGAADHTTILK